MFLLRIDLIKSYTYIYMTGKMLLVEWRAELSQWSDWFYNVYDVYVYLYAHDDEIFHFGVFSPYNFSRWYHTQNSHFFFWKRIKFVRLRQNSFIESVSSHLSMSQYVEQVMMKGNRIQKCVGSHSRADRPSLDERM